MGNIKDGERTGKWLLRCIISALAIIGIGKITCQSKDIYILLGREWKSKTSPGMAKLLAPDSKDGRAGWISSSHHMFKGSIWVPNKMPWQDIVAILCWSNNQATFTCLEEGESCKLVWLAPAQPHLNFLLLYKWIWVCLYYTLSMSFEILVILSE